MATKKLAKPVLVSRGGRKKMSPIAAPLQVLAQPLEERMTARKADAQAVVHRHTGFLTQWCCAILKPCRVAQTVTCRDLRDLLAAKDELLAGRRIVIAALAGPRLSGKKGIVLGQGATATQVKVLLDGAKGYVILHARYVDLFEDRSATEGV
ncbi:hypothetical protein G6321_00036075 [Bradyrhizobium barranii subsp. barranii]|uniref:Uncharacterized protein n=1 Tax=Bradyrhizobium barranii subsp. barranii TaxID=2823807 RepID=A0A9X9YJS8_9BRAD|nr:hypothetical protein [Bradyrhizobium barranii]UGX91183.1 hypothetical protein G6321_00036075 [Bradyrhizobium barranii subsp. barranii]